MSGMRKASGPAEDAEFESVFLEHYSGILQVLTRLVGRGQAEELANEVFFRLSRQPARWLLTNNVGAWLYRTATHRGIDALRSSAQRERYERAASVQKEANEPGPLTGALRQEDCRNVRTVLSAMKPVRAQILLMRANGSSYKEISETLEVAIGSVGTLLNRAEAEFRKRYLKLTGGGAEL
jgi:RNA polymerase sigma-70 factor (ECF subfamily)